MRSLIDVRPLQSRDLEACVALAREDGARGPSVDTSLLADLLRRHLLIGRVIEERSGASRCRIRGFGLSALVKPDVIAAARRDAQQDFVATLLAESVGEGGALLDRRDGARLGPRGTREMVVINFVVDPTAAGTGESATSLLHRAFIEAHSGYALAGLTTEARPWERKFEPYSRSLRAMGCREARARGACGTRIFWMTADDVLAHGYHILQPLFVRRHGQLDLTAAQRDVLELASLGIDDSGIAATLGIAIDTVHKRWRSIHARALERLPGLIVRGTGDHSTDARFGVRGPEKRRTLVEFARLHPEEIRP